MRPVCSLSQAQQSQVPPLRLHTRPTIWYARSWVQQPYPVVFLRMQPEITLTWMADTSPLHSYVHFLFKHMHDHLWIVVNSCIQPLLISIKPFVRSLHYHYIVSPHQRNCICNLVRGGDELDTVQNKKPVLSYPWLRPEPEISLSQRCRQTTVRFVLQ